jgi:hypothetical protein
MIALTKILIALLISIFCALTGLNLDGNENIVKKENISNLFETHQIIACTKIPKGESV